MSETKIIPTLTKVSNYKEGAINIAAPFGGMVIGGIINKVTANLEFVQSNKKLIDGALFLLSCAAQFLPASFMPKWGKGMAVGCGLYSALSLFSGLATDTRLPEALRKTIAGFVPGLAGLRGAPQMGSIADLWANETSHMAPADARMPVMSQNATPTILNGLNRVPYLGN